MLETTSAGRLALAGLLALSLVAAAPAQAPAPSPPPPTPPAPPAAGPSPAPVQAAAPVPATAVPAPAPPAVEWLTFGRFGKFPVYHPAGPTGTIAEVALLVSPDLAAPAAGRTAAALTAMGTLVIGVDSTRYSRQIDTHHGTHCAYAAADFETLSHFVQQRLGLADYLPPVLVGEGAASTLTYATLAQSPPDTFEGAVTSGFCRVLLAPDNLCPGEGLHWEDAYKGPGALLRPHPLQNPWVVLDGAPLPGCASTGAVEFVPKVRGAQILPAFAESASGDAASAESLAAKLKLALVVVAAKRREEAAARAARSEDIRDLPLVEMPAPTPGRRTLMVIVSGDGGWVGLDARLADRLSKEQGIPIVGLNSLQYFWTSRTPAGAAADLGRVLDHYLAAWKLDDAVVLGYSQGADVVPFMVTRLPRALRSRVKLVVIVGTSGGATFDYNFGTYMAQKKPKPDLPVAPEIARLKGTKVLCVYGNRESDSLCRKLGPKVASPLELQTGHGFGHDNGILLAGILDASGLKPAPKGSGR